jgi:hypothetical protein
MGTARTDDAVIDDDDADDGMCKALNRDAIELSNERDNHDKRIPIHRLHPRGSAKP